MRSDSAVPNSRLPLEHARILDSICSTTPFETPLFAWTRAPALLQAVVNRHGRVFCPSNLADSVSTRNDGQITPVADTGCFATMVDRAIVLEPAGDRDVRRVADTVESQGRLDVVVGNPYSYNRVEDRTVNGSWHSPVRTYRTLAEYGFDVAAVGYHGPGSVLRSAIGRLWQALGRTEKRDVFTHRMRAVFRESSVALASLSCLVHLKGVRR